MRKTAVASLSKKYERSLEKTIAIRARLRSVGTTRPVSNCDKKLAESPVSLPSSTNPIDFFSRSRRIRSPMHFSAITRAVVSAATCDICVSSLFTTGNSLIDPPASMDIRRKSGKCCAHQKQFPCYQSRIAAAILLSLEHFVLLGMDLLLLMEDCHRISSWREETRFAQAGHSVILG